MGLLGGSLALAAKERHLARRVVGYVRREASLADCQQLGLADLVTMDLAEAVAGADLVVFCTPIRQMRSLAECFAPLLAPGTIVTDVGSAKKALVHDLTPFFARHRVHFVGSHPMAGGEKTGPSAAVGNLFDNAVCVVTPGDGVSPAAVRKVERFWKALGGRVLRLPPGRHDALAACSSHLPHLVASALAAHVLNPQHPRDLATLCATGFRDTTRVASGSPEMWKDIVIENRTALLRQLRAFVRQLRDLEKLVESGNEKRLLKFFSDAKARRDGWLAHAASPSPE